MVLLLYLKVQKNETKELFNQIKPLLDKGMIYSKAIKIVKGLPEEYSLTRRAWYHDLLNYGESQGYPYKNHSGNQGGCNMKKISVKELCSMLLDLIDDGHGDKTVEVSVV